MNEHTVRQGDCICSIAEEAGLFWETVWDHPDNSDLRNLRKDPNILAVGDVVKVPDLRQKEESCASEQRHKFRRRGVPGMLRLRLLEDPEEERAEDEGDEVQPDQGAREVSTEDPEYESEEVEKIPRSSIHYIIEIDGIAADGETDSDGRLEVSIPPNAKSGLLRLNPGTDREEKIRLDLGALEPITELPGVKQRLANLGFECGDRTTEPTDGLAAALKAFQEHCGLEPTGELTDETRNRIKEEHGS